MGLLTIGEARRMKNISQKEMSKMVHCSYSAYRMKERYDVPMTSNEVADFLAITGFPYDDINFYCSNRVFKKTQSEGIVSMNSA